MRFEKSAHDALRVSRDGTRKRHRSSVNPAACTICASCISARARSFLVAFSLLPRWAAASAMFLPLIRTMTITSWYVIGREARHAESASRRSPAAAAEDGERVSTRQTFSADDDG